MCGLWRFACGLCIRFGTFSGANLMCFLLYSKFFRIFFMCFLLFILILNKLFANYLIFNVLTNWYLIFVLNLYCIYFCFYNVRARLVASAAAFRSCACCIGGGVFSFRFLLHFQKQKRRRPVASENRNGGGVFGGA